MPKPLMSGQVFDAPTLLWVVTNLPVIAVTGGVAPLLSQHVSGVCIFFFKSLAKNLVSGYIYDVPTLFRDDSGA